MSIATQLSTLNNLILDAYNAIDDLEGTIPTYKNMNNLATAIASIPQGYPNSLAYLAYDDLSNAQGYVNICNTTPLGSASHAFAASSASTTLTTLDLSRFTSFANVVDLICFLENNTALTTLTLPSTCDFSNVVSMSGTFRNVGLTTIDLSGWTTSTALLTMYNMFVSDDNLTTVTFGSNWDTGKVQSFYGLFNSCPALTTINGFSYLSMASMTDMRAMFYNDTSLTSVDFSGQTINDDFYVSSQTANYALYGLTACVSMNLTGLKCAASDLSNTHVYGENTAMTTLTYGGKHRIASESSSYVLSDALLNLIEDQSGSTITTLDLSDSTFFSTDGSETEDITSVSDIWGGSAIVSADLSGWDVSAVDFTDLTADKMFTGSDNLTTLDLSGWTNTDGLNFGTMIGSDYVSGGSYVSAAPNLATLILDTDSVVSVNTSGSGQTSSANAFAGTPIDDGTGHIYVPSSLVSSYQSDSFWGNYSDVITALEG